MPKPGRTRQKTTRLPPILPIALLAFIAAATYINALDVPFVWDDDTAIVTNQSIRGSLTEALSPPLETPVSGRPVVNLSFAINYAAGMLDPPGYHVWNLAVLVASALLLFGIVRRTLTAQKAFRDARFTDAVAMVAALTWMVHPLLSETVDYVTQRSESMLGLFFLLTLYAAIRARDPRHATLWQIASVASCALGMATKESMVTAPVAVVLYDLVFEFDSAGQALASRKFLYAGLAASWLELGAIMWRWPRSTVGAATTVNWWTYLLNQAEMIARYLLLAIWPQSLVVDYGLPRMVAIGDVLPQAAIVIVLAAATVFAFLRWRAVGLLGAMFFLTLAPTSSVVPISSEVGAERRMYLPLAALVVLVVTAAGILVDRIRGRSPARARTMIGIAAGVSVAIIAALAVRTVYRNREYATPLTLWESVVARRPQGRARFALANQLMEAGRHDEAIVQLRAAIADFPDARAGLGAELLYTGQTGEGVAVLETFVQANPSAPNRAPARPLIAGGYRVLAERSLRQQHPVEAAEQARQSLLLDPGNADAHNLLGVALASQNRVDAAIAEFQEAIRINPQHPSAANNMARAAAILQQRK